MYYPLYNNPFYYPYGAYMKDICSYGHASNTISNLNNNYNFKYNDSNKNNASNSRHENIQSNGSINSDLFSINDDRLEVFGISINIDDLIILIMLFFMFRESHIDYSIIIVLALILFDQN